MLKAPFTEIGNPFNRTISDVEEVPYIYSGGDVSDSPEFWTEHLPDALGYALYGSAMPRRNEQGSFTPNDRLFRQTIGGMRETVPTIWRVKNPIDFDFPLEPDPNSEGFREGFFDEGMEIEQMPDDEIRTLIHEIVDDRKKLDEMDGNTGNWFDWKAVNEHTKNALRRLETGQAGRLDIPFEARPHSQTSLTDDYGFEEESEDYE